MHYAEDGTGPPVLLLHQTPRSWDEFRELIPLLAPRHRVVAMDMLGFGASAQACPPHTIEAMAGAALDLLDALGVARCAVLGHHTGALVALELAARAPDRVTALVLSSPPWPDAAYRRSHASGPAVDTAERASDGSHLLTLWGKRAAFYPEPATALLDRFLHDALTPGLDPAEGHRAVARYVVEERIGLVRAPVLLLGADADPFARPNIEPVRAHLAGAASVTTVIIPGGTIPLMEHRPDAVAAAVLPFLAGTGGG
ncbi:MAG TPA: alpha/beta hydrolase [Pseudonocardiaceae bacterium]|nr:alpha/beta hydrolase [Pseudonocardiaceae bacterium]